MENVRVDELHGLVRTEDGVDYLGQRQIGSSVFRAFQLRPMTADQIIANRTLDLCRPDDTPERVAWLHDVVAQSMGYH